MTSRIQCPQCGGLMASHARICRACLRPDPEPHESWSWPVARLVDAMHAASMTVAELARLSGVPERSIMYARAGMALSRQNAMAVAQVLRINPVSMLAVLTDRRGWQPRRRPPEDPRQGKLDLT